jgi:formiminotetrahydrofolate cyclodeaminase
VDVASLTVDELLQRLGSADPTPGGGCVAALSGAMAAAMLSMVCNLTVGRPRYAEIEAEATAIRDACQRQQRVLVALADADAEAYGAVSEAYRLPRAGDRERAERAEAIESAMHRATEVPVRTAEAARSVLDLAVRSAVASNVSVVADVAVAAHLALASLRGALDQAELNLASVKDHDFVAEMEARIAPVLAGSAAATESVSATVRRRAAGG